jgi:hypothetical protein
MMGIIRESATMGGMNLFTRLPIVEPKRMLGMIMRTTLKSMSDVLRVGCLLKMRSKKL